MLTRTGCLKTGSAQKTHQNANCTRTVLVLMWTSVIRIHANSCLLLLIAYARSSIKNAQKTKKQVKLYNTYTRIPALVLVSHCERSLKTCPHCRRKVRPSPFCRRFRRQSPFSATVSLFCDSVDRALLATIVDAWGRNGNKPWGLYLASTHPDP